MTLNLDKSAWKRVTLRDVVYHVTDRVDPETSGLKRFLAGEHIPSENLAITDWGVIGKDPIGPMFYKRFLPGHVLYVSRRTYLRKVAIPEFEGITGEKTFVLESTDRSVLLQEFLPFVMSAERFHAYAVANSRGSVNPYLNWGELAAYEFDLPPVDEQKRLADLLWAIERHRRSVGAALDDLALSRSQWFAETLKAGAESRGWAKEPVTKLVTSGPTNGKSARANDQQRGVPTLSISAIRDGRVLGGSSVKYMDVDASEVANFVIEEDDFLIVRGNGNKRLAGRGGVAGSGLPAGCVYPDLLIRLRFDREVILTPFAAEQWNSTAAHGELIQRAKSTNGIWKINGKDIKSHQLIVPPIDAQERMLERLGIFEASAGSARGELAAIDDFWTSIMSDVFGVD